MSATTTSPATVHVISFAPSTDANAVGGFVWAGDAAEARRIYDDEVADTRRYDDGHIVRLLAVPVDETSQDAITEELDSRIDELEMTARALRQYVPEHTDADRIPNAGADHSD